VTRRVDLLGVGVDGVPRADLLDVVAALLRRGRATVAYANVHVVNVAHGDAPLRAFLAAADLVYCDGGGVVLGARLLGEHLPDRMTGADWIWDLAARAEREGWRLYWMGGEPGVTSAAAARLQERHPALVVGTDHGFHPDAAAVVARMNAFAPDIVLVGMGTPLQERWVAAHRGAIAAPVVWVTGATADFVSGKVSRGPAWLHDRQEWLARLLVDPRRLWRRYLLGNTVFLGRVARARLRREPGAATRT
jgi:N-acetylglucosaminyldiphosphoundecaprenol N-acetyl-beta-D-mannosaminyltransferase